MIKVVGIRFQRAGKIYYFDPLDYDLETAMHVIVETARGVEMGTADGKGRSGHCTGTRQCGKRSLS